MFVKNAWYVAGWSGDLDADGLLARQLLGNRVVFFRQQDGTPAALEDKCCHRFAPLSHGRREGDCLRCMYHGLKFDAAGSCVEVPGQQKINPALRVRSYPVVERDTFLWIWMGDPARANPADIHDAHWQTDPAWHTASGGYIHYASNCQLITDNLLDFSHLAYVHGQSIGSTAFAQQRPVIERGENRVTVKYSNPGIARPPFLGVLSALPDTVDRSNFYDWYVKGNFFAQDTVVSPAASGDRDSTRAETVRIRTIIALTPETDSTTHYFWSVTHNDFTSQRSDVTATLSKALSAAFEEDRLIIDAQQRVINDAGNVGMMPIEADALLFRVRNMETALIEAEVGN